MADKAFSNANFHQATEKSVFDTRSGPEFAEYRRKWRENPRDFVVGEFPIHIDIESTNACNLKCPFCATTTEHWGPSNVGLMDMRVFRRIIDEGADSGLCAIKLSLRGEPLLHNGIVEMVRYAKQKGIMDVYFNTNGMLLDRERSADLIDAGLDRISVSLEGIDPVAYEKYRPGAKFDTVKRNLETLAETRVKRGVKYPQIRIQTVLLPELKEIFGDYVNYWEYLADEVDYLDARAEGPQYDHTGKTADWACPFLWQRMTILWDGTLLPCLMHGVDDFSLMSLGNVSEVSIREMWNSLREHQIRELHRAGAAHELPACDKCSYRAMEIEKTGYTG